MKKLLLKPGFEFIFSIAIVAIFGLPAIVFAQKTKDLNITIVNGDTTVNGKNIKDLSRKDRKDAMNNIGNINNISSPDSSWHKVVIKRMHRDINGYKNDDIVINGPIGNNPPMAGGDMERGSHRGNMKFRMRKQIDGDSTLAFNYRMNEEPPRGMEEREWRFRGPEEGRMMGFERRNTQNFNYINTDEQGISTHVNYHVSEHPGALRNMENEKGQLDILDVKDLTLVPEFSAGKTLLTFSLPAKVVASVQFKDNKGNMIWSEKAINGHFSKAFSLGLNGEYFLQVKQGSKIAVKEIMKD